MRPHSQARCATRAPPPQGRSPAPGPLCTVSDAAPVLRWPPPQAGTLQSRDGTAGDSSALFFPALLCSLPPCSLPPCSLLSCSLPPCSALFFSLPPCSLPLCPALLSSVLLSSALRRRSALIGALRAARRLRYVTWTAHASRDYNSGRYGTARIDRHLAASRVVSSTAAALNR